MKSIQKRPAWSVALLAAVSAALYFFAFVQPYGLLDWWRSPGQSIGKMSSYGPGAGATYVAVMGVLCLVYWLVLRLVRGPQPRRVWAAVLAGAVAFNLVLLWLYPVDAADVFDYINRGRMSAIHGANPFYDLPVDFPQDAFHGYNAWEYATSAYGPWWEALAGVTARFAGNGVVENVIAFKLVSIFAYALTASLIAMLLKRIAPDRTLYGVTLFLWNPLVVYTTAGNGHNDTVMMLWVVLGFYLLARGHYTLAVLAETGGALVKYIPLLIVPVILVAAWQQIKGWRQHLTYLVVTGAASLLLIVASYAPYWRGPGDILGVERRSQLYTTSIATLLRIAVEPSVGLLGSQQIASRLALAALAAWIGWVCLRLWLLRPPGKVSSDAEVSRYVSAAASILLFYLLVACLWFQAWYVIWPLALVALLPEGTLSTLTILLSAAGLWKMPLFEFLIYDGKKLPPEGLRESQLTLGTLGVPWIYALTHAFRPDAAASWLRRVRGTGSMSRKPSMNAEPD